MKKSNAIKPERVRETTMQVEDFAQIAEQHDSLVEHMTIPGFLRRIPHRWHMNEIGRFGYQVGKAAEDMHLAYFTAVDRSLGVIRVFPVPLLERVYTLIAPQFGWPKLIEALPLDDRQTQTIRASERARKSLQTVADEVSDPEVSSAMAVVMGWLEKRAQAEGEPAPPPLRAL